MQRSILITGCSSGIGLHTALTLQKQGYRVFASVRKLEDQQKLIAQGLDCILLDVSDSTSIQNALNSILEKTGGTLDGLFNNAGYVQAGAVEDLSRDMMREQFETNVFGAMELTNKIIPIMRKQGHGHIIQNTSILGIVAMPYRGAYNASKFALEGFSSTLRQELRDTHIYVSMLVPGPIRSELRTKAFSVYQETLSKKESIHKSLYKKMESYFFAPEENERRFTLGPDAVTKKVVTILESKKPKAHYYIGFPAHLFAFLHRLLPDSAMEWIMNRVIEGEKKS